MTSAEGPDLMAAADSRDLQATETTLQGDSVDLGTRIVPDEVNVRISYLVRARLQSVATAEGGWLHLFRDPADGRYWELSYPEGQEDRTGPRRLAVIEPAVATGKYQLGTG